MKDAEQAREVAVHAEIVDLRAFAEVLAARDYFVCLRTGKPDKCCPGVAALKHTFVVAGVCQGRLLLPVNGGCLCLARPVWQAASGAGYHREQL